MLILFGILLAVPGGLAVLAGLSGRRRVRRLRRRGVATWALAVTAPAPASRQSAGSPRQQVIRYTLADGRVLEQIIPEPAKRSTSLRPGQKVLVWHDPEDPGDVLVYGRWGRAADRAFVIAGALSVLAGAGIAVFGH
jgi:Protein of unknown function (DUF3592)